VGTRCADHVTPLYPQKLALTSSTGGRRSVGIVRVRTKATEFVCLLDNLTVTLGTFNPRPCTISAMPWASQLFVANGHTLYRGLFEGRLWRTDSKRYT